MIRKFKIILLLLIASVFLCDCRQKKLFKYVEVVGRLLHKNGSGYDAAAGIEITLRADDRYLSRSAYDGYLKLATVTTDSGGNFRLKSKASRARTNRYYLQVKGQFILIFYNPEENAITHVGDVSY